MYPINQELEELEIEERRNNDEEELQRLIEEENKLERWNNSKWNTNNRK